MERHIVVGTSEQLQALGIKEREQDSWFRGYAMATYIDDELGYSWAETFFGTNHQLNICKGELDMTLKEGIFCFFCSAFIGACIVIALTKELAL
jgi:hypothetical protein